MSLLSAAPPERYVLVAKTDSDYNALRQDAIKLGARIVRDLRSIKMLVVSAPSSFRPQIEADAHADGVARDQIRHIVPPEMQKEMFGKTNGGLTRIRVPAAVKKPAVTPDPAFQLPGLMWSIQRIHAPEAWKTTTGQPGIKVGVADTGLDFTHSELAAKVVQVVDLTVNEDPPICKTLLGFSDADLSAQFGGPETTDWNGHGSWIGGNIAGALDGVGINGIAPGISLVALKISQWCGSAYDSTILDSFVYAADHGIDIVSISFGGYLDLSDHDQFLIYKQYVQTVGYALLKGTTIVAALGNEHAQIGVGGIVMSHGSLTIPGDTVSDLHGLFQNPGGVPGVVAVSSTGNLVNAPSPTCPSGTVGSTCKLATDPHQPSGVGKQDQLAYYSNYGPRVDFAAPGGARKFNLPVWDGGGTPGYPVTTADGYNAWEDFSITSNWATQIPCYFFADASSGFYPNECYSTIQGTSMATPHVSAALALVASANPWVRHIPVALVLQLKSAARQVAGNTTQPLSATDTSPGDVSGAACPTGYCHLGGPRIPDKEAYGVGIVDVRKLR